MAVLVTGGAGFIGAFVARKLVEEGYDVVVFDVQRSERLGMDVEFVEGSVTSVADLAKVFVEHRIDGVIHAAADLSMKAEKQHANAFKTNVEGTFNVLEVCRIFNCKKIIFISSHSVYGPKSEMPITETTFRDPTTFYGATKVCGEVIGTFYNYAHGMDFRVVRFPTVIGPYRSGEGASVTFSSFIDQAVLKGEATLELPPETKMPVIYIKDAIEVILKLYRKEKVARPIYNVGGIPVSLKDLIEAAKKFVDFKVTFKIDETAEQIARQWTMMTLIAESSGLINKYRKIEELDWELKFDTPEKIVEDHISMVRS